MTNTCLAGQVPIIIPEWTVGDYHPIRETEDHKFHHTPKLKLRMSKFPLFYAQNSSERVSEEF